MLSLTAAAPVVAQQTPPAPASSPQTVPAPPNAPLVAATGVMRATLDNGLRVVVVPNKLAPVVTTNLSYLAGSNEAPTGFPGTAHALEHMMFRGSDGLDRDQLAEIGAQLGGIYNASTTETVTQYTYTIPAADLGAGAEDRGAAHARPDDQPGRLGTGAGCHRAGGVTRQLSSPFYLYYRAAAEALLFADSPLRASTRWAPASRSRSTDAALLRQLLRTAGTRPTTPSWSSPGT